MQSYLTQALKIPDLKKKIIFVFAILALYRFLAHIPVPGVDTNALRELFQNSQFLSFLNIFTGGGLQNLSIVALGVGPYITASIIIQVMTMAFPALEELSKEGAAGRQKLNQYTRFLTLPLSIVQAYSIYFLLGRQDVAGATILPVYGPFDLILVLVSMAAGSFFLMWLGNTITEYGVGNGVSVIIFAGILASIPSSAGQLFAGFETGQAFNVILLLVVFLAVIAGVVYVNEAYRKIEVQYSTKLRGSRNVGGGNSFIPVKINQAGVIPIIFAVSLVLIPSAAAGYLQNVSNVRLSEIGVWLSVNFASGSALYNIFYFILVFGFTYFYTSVTFNPKKIAEDIRKSGGFIPGIRPGKATEEFLKYIINRLTLAGGLFLGLIAVLPGVVQGLTNISSLAIGGTGLLIVVSVVLETIKQIESQVITRDYESISR